MGWNNKNRNNKQKKQTQQIAKEAPAVPAKVFLFVFFFREAPKQNLTQRMESAKEYFKSIHLKQIQKQYSIMCKIHYLINHLK